MKTKLLLSFLLASMLSLNGQTPRLCLYELFTGETCPPTAISNPAINALLAQPANAAKMVAINWEVPIPSAPTNTWSLYQTNKAEINWRYLNTSAGYGYPIVQSPMGLIDGQSPLVFGAGNIHTASMNSTVIATAQSYTSAFSISMSKSWDATFSSVTLSVSVLATANFTANGALVFRTVMTERNVDFPVQSGTNGEKHFEYVVIKSFPSIQAGIGMASTWAIGQTQTFTLNCPLPSYVRDKSQVGFVGFIQDDGNKKVAQACCVLPNTFANDIKLTRLLSIPLSCSNTAYSSTLQLKNTGTTSVNAFTLNTSINGTGVNSIPWSGNLNPGDSLSFSLPSFSTAPLASGTNTIYNTIVMPGDNNLPNNSITMNVNSPAPIINVVSTHTLVCVGDLVTLVATGANQYSWTSNINATNSMSLVASQTTTFTVIGTNTLSNCSTQVNYVLRVEECLGLKSNGQQNLFELRPNPFSTAFKITCSTCQKPGFYHVYDVFGKLVLEGVLEEESALIQTDQFPTGIYFVTIGKERKKIVKVE